MSEEAIIAVVVLATTIVTAISGAFSYYRIVRNKNAERNGWRPVEEETNRLESENRVMRAEMKDLEAERRRLTADNHELLSENRKLKTGQD